MDPTSFRELGRTGLELTTLGLGSAPLGGFRGPIPEDEALDTVQAAYDAGVNYFDTSPYYGYGRSEHRFGQVLRQVNRESFVLSTKIGRVLNPLPPGAQRPENYRDGGLSFAPTYDYSYDGTMRSIEDSYQRLGLPSIDIVFIHDVDLYTHKDPDLVDRYFGAAMEGAYVALDELRSAGVIRAIGGGLNDAESCARFQRAGDFDCMMLAGRYTLLDQRALDDMLPLCAKQGVGVLIAGPFNSGILATGPVAGAMYDYSDASKSILDKVRNIDSVCQRHDVALQAAALQFPLGHTCVSAVVPGAVKPAEVEANVAHMATPIPADFWAELKHEGLVGEAAPIPEAD
jgi:D-threo-aldose 1-dehydrogenase